MQELSSWKDKSQFSCQIAWKKKIYSRASATDKQFDTLIPVYIFAAL